jgi:hypothetical protein
MVGSGCLVGVSWSSNSPCSIAAPPSADPSPRTSPIADLTSLRGGPPGKERYEPHVAATVDAMRAGAEVIHQGLLFDGTWLGYPDFLQKVDRPSPLGAWSLEVIDAKLVACGRLFFPECRTMRLANGLCRHLETENA